MIKASIPDQYIASRRTMGSDDLISAIIETGYNSQEIQSGLTEMFQVRATGKGPAQNCDTAFIRHLKDANGSFYFMSKTNKEQEHQFIGFVANEKAAYQFAANLTKSQLRGSFTNVSVHAPSAPTKTATVSESKLSLAMA